MKVEDNHAHAITYYEGLGLKSFFAIFTSVIMAKFKGLQSLTVHLPLEVQHPQVFKNKQLGLAYIKFGELLKSIFQLKLYWENAPLLEYDTWKLKYGQLNWDDIPEKISLCLDTGHLILGSKNKSDAQNRILSFNKKFLNRIGHLHIHENNLQTDIHKKPKFIITPHILKLITKNRTYIYEK